MRADTSSIYFPSQRGHRLVGAYFLAETEQPTPLAVLAHGIPGAEKNQDLAYALRQDGWHVLVPHLGGTWGSGGDYSMTEQPDDIKAAIDYALSPQGERPVNVHKIAAVGFSLGSRAAIMSALEDPRIGAVVSLGGICDFSELMFSEAFFKAASPLLAGTTPESARAQWAALGDGLQPSEAIKQIAPRPVLVVHGTEDEVVPFYNADGLTLNGGDHIRRVNIEGANHVFGSYRAEVIATVREFLNGWAKT